LNSLELLQESVQGVLALSSGQTCSGLLRMNELRTTSNKQLFLSLLSKLRSKSGEISSASGFHLLLSTDRSLFLGVATAVVGLLGLTLLELFCRRLLEEA